MYIMAAVGQMREDELRPDQLEIGKIYRIEKYIRPGFGKEPNQIERSLGILNKSDDIFMDFTIVPPGTSTSKEMNIRILTFTQPGHLWYYKFFQTAQDRIVPQFEQRALQKVFGERMGLDKATAWGLSDGLFAPSKKSGGRKYKTRQTKLRRKNRTKKNRRRMNRR
jgi:hypothetical protein